MFIFLKANCTLALIRRNFKLAPEEVKERAYTFTWLDHKSSLWCPWTKRVIIALRRSRDVPLDLSDVLSVSELISYIED